MDKYHYVGYYGYNFVHRLSVTEYARECQRERQGKQGESPELDGSEQSLKSAPHSPCSWVKRKRTILTFLLLLISVIFFIVSTKWKTDKITIDMAAPKNLEPIVLNHRIVTHAPHQTMLTEQSIPHKFDWQLTNASLSTYLITTPAEDIRAGKKLHVSIQSRNGRDEELRTGGDFWLATMIWSSTPKASCAGKVTDHNNGTYTVTFHTVRTGLGQLHIILVHPKRAVDFLRTQLWNTETRIYWYGQFDFREQNYWTQCFVTREIISEDKFCLFGNPDALGETVFACRKYENVPCDTLSHTLVNHDLTTNRTLDLVGENLYMFKRSNYWNRLKKGPHMIYIKNEYQKPKSGKVSQTIPPLPPCGPALPLPTSSNGYWFAERWHSLVCSLKQWNIPAEIGTCLRGKHLYILGGSTLRQWVNCLHYMMGVQYEQQPHDKFYSDRYIEAYDVNITFRFHPQIVSGFQVDVNDPEYEVDVLDGLIDKSCNYIIAIGPWAHFNQWTRESYVERLILLRQAVEKLRQRCPHVPIVVKGSHPREHYSIESVIYASDYILYKMGVLMQDIFADSGVWFLDVWEMNLAYPTDNNIHMPWEVVEQELNMFLSYACHYIAPDSKTGLGGKLTEFG